MVTPREVIDALIQQSDTRTKISLIRDWYPEIERALESGVRYGAINKVLAENGISLTEPHLRQAVHTLRNQARVKSAKLTKASSLTSAPAAKQSATALLPRVRTGPKIVEVDYPLRDNLPPGVNLDLTSGWELEHQDAIIPPELLNKAFTEIAGISVDLRQPCPPQFGEQGEEVKHKVNPSSPNWPKYKARARARITYAQDLSYWQREFRKWLISQGYTGTQY